MSRRTSYLALLSGILPSFLHKFVVKCEYIVYFRQHRPSPPSPAFFILRGLVLFMPPRLLDSRLVVRPSLLISTNTHRSAVLEHILQLISSVELYSPPKANPERETLLPLFSLDSCRQTFSQAPIGTSQQTAYGKLFIAKRKAVRIMRAILYNLYSK